MNNLPKPTLWIIAAVLTWAAGAGAAYWQYGNYSDQIAEYQRFDKLVQRPEEVEAERADSAQKLIDAQAHLEHLEQGVPEFAYVPTLLKELEAFGIANGIEVFGVRPMPNPVQTPKDKEKKRVSKAYVELLIEVKGRGKYENVMRFVRGLQSFPKIVASKAVSLSPRNDTQNENTSELDVTVELKTFLFPPKGDVAAPADLPGASNGAGLTPSNGTAGNPGGTPGPTAGAPTAPNGTQGAPAEPGVRITRSEGKTRNKDIANGS